MESLLATWSCPSEPFQPVLTPCREHASDAVRERLSLVSGRRDEATAAWEAWRKAKGQVQSCRARLHTLPRRGAELESSEREEWTRGKNDRARKALRRQIMIDHELKQQALQMHSKRMDRVEAGRAARAAAARLRRAKEDMHVVESRKKARLRVLRRQLKQLSELDASPFLLEMPQLSQSEESRPGGVKLGSLPASLRQGQRSNKSSSRGDNSIGATPRKDQDAVKRMRPAELVAEFRHKRDIYLGSRVRTVSAQLVGKPSPSLCLIEESPKVGTPKVSNERTSQRRAYNDEDVSQNLISANNDMTYTTKVSSEGISQRPAHTDEQVAQNWISENTENETVVQSNASKLNVECLKPAPSRDGEKQGSEASEGEHEYEEDFDDDYEDGDEFGNSESEENHSASAPYECEQSESDHVEQPLEPAVAIENARPGHNDEPVRNTNTSSEDNRHEPGNSPAPSSALEAREDVELDNEEDQANYDDDFEEREPVAAVAECGLWTDDEDENEPALYTEMCGAEVSTDAGGDAESGASHLEDIEEQPLQQ